MADFRIWGKVEHIGVKQFLAIVSAVPEAIGDRPIVLSSIVPNLIEANQERARLMQDAGGRVRARGDRVVDAESE